MDDEVSRVVAMAWGVAAAPQRGPKRELTHERIVDTAMEIADEEGLQAVTMQRVAQAFGYTTMALYRYVANKDELHRLMLDAAFTRIPAPAFDEGWRAGLVAWMGWLGDSYRKHPWVVEVPVSMEALLMPGQMVVADAAMRAMADLPITDGERLALLITLSTFQRGMAGIEQDLDLGASAISPATRELIREVATPELLPELHRLVASGAYFGETPNGAPAVPDPAEGSGDADAEFAVGIRVLLAGIESEFASRDAVPEEESDARPVLSPEGQLQQAEGELAAAIAARKAAQLRVKELERRESAARKTRDRAKEVAKAAAKLARD